MEATGDLTGNKVVNRVQKVSKNSEAITNRNDKKNVKKNMYLRKKDKKLLMN